MSLRLKLASAPGYFNCEVPAGCSISMRSVEALLRDAERRLGGDCEYYFTKDSVWFRRIICQS